MVVNDRSYTENLPKYPKSHRIFKLQSSRQATASKNCRNCSTQGVPCAKPWTSFNCSSEKFVRIKSSTLDSLDTRTSAWSWLGHVGTSSKVMTKCWATCFQCDCEAPLWTCAPGHSSEFCVHQLLVFEGLQVSGHLPSLGFEKRDWSLPCSMGSSQHELTDFYPCRPPSLDTGIDWANCPWTHPLTSAILEHGIWGVCKKERREGRPMMRRW